MSYSIRYHGNYCGPGWSDGKYQSSVIGSTPPVDDFDATCQAHDAAYHYGNDLSRADWEFAASNFLQGPKRTLAAIGVATQAILRGNDSIIKQPNESITTTHNMTNLRGARPSVTLTSMPAAMGYTIRSTAPQIKRKGNTTTIVGADYAGSVVTSNTNNYQPAASVFLNPAYFQNAMLGSQARVFEKFRFTRASVHYIPAVPTDTDGQLVMCSTRTVKEPFINGSSSTFLSRALSQGNAVACPLWKETILDVECNGDWQIVDALIDGDLDDCIQEEVQCYTTASLTLTAGILMLHYEIEFKDPLYTFHSTVIPVPMGNGSYGTLVDNSAANSINDTIRLTTATGTLSFGGGVGSVYRLVFRQEASTLPTGPANWAAVAAIQNNMGTNSTSIAAAATTISLTTGTVLYGLYVGSDVALYSSLEAASLGGTGGQLIYAANTTVAGTWAFLGQMVRLGDAVRVVSQ